MTGPFTRRRLIQDIALLRSEVDALETATETVSAAVRLGIKVSKTPTNVATGDLFAITGGRILLMNLIGEVTTVVETQTNTTKILFDPTGAGASTDLCATLDLTASAVGEFLTMTGTLATALVRGVRRSLLMATPQVLETGMIELACGATNTGVIRWDMWYLPIDEGAAVAAA